MTWTRNDCFLLSTGSTHYLSSIIPKLIFQCLVAQAPRGSVLFTFHALVSQKSNQSAIPFKLCSFVYLS